MCGGEATATIASVSEFGMKAAMAAASDDIRMVIAFEGIME